jgi:hypothetical protein
LGSVGDEGRSSVDCSGAFLLGRGGRRSSMRSAVYEKNGFEDMRRSVSKLTINVEIG